MFQNNIENKQPSKYINYDEIPIKTVNNFVELVEKNLAELKFEQKRGKSERKKIDYDRIKKIRQNDKK